MSSTSSCGVETPLSPLAQATLDKHLPNLSLKRGLHAICYQKNLGTKTDAECLTDICNKENLPEIEICSLLEEKIPKYKIRLDVLTNFAGYTNNDWFVPAPALHIPSCGLGLNNTQARETLNYFLLCGNRVSQMTRTYDDIEAVTRLLEEKEKDLELTVQIGKELLSQNIALENKISDLESNIKALNEDHTQLLHEMQRKAQLIAILTDDIDDNSENDTPAFSKSVTLDLLQKKIASLQDENKSLKIEASQIVCQTDKVEEQERRLMENITSQLNEVNSQFDYLSLELERQKEENRFQHEQIVSLNAQFTETQLRLNHLIQENEDQTILLNITKENQNSLALELVEFKTRYQEVLSLLHEAQDQLRKHKKRTQTHIRSSFIPSLSMQSDSLHSELMGSSLYSENSIDSGFFGDRIYEKVNNNLEISSQKRAFEMLRYTACSKNFNYLISSSSISVKSCPTTKISTMPRSNSFKSDERNCCNNNIVWAADVSNENINIQQTKCLHKNLNSQSDDDYPSQSSGIPGAPGAKDLESALKRLSPGEVLAKRAIFSCDPIEIQSYEENPSLDQHGTRTPDSLNSAECSGMQEISSVTCNNTWRLPEKLQIVKPIEGSQTLHHWSKLATPTLSGLLEDRPGVTIRGGRGLAELGLQVYSLSDVEEDIEYLPRKQFEAAGCVYTYTTSTVMHPDDCVSNDLFFISKSQVSSRLASVSTSRQPSCPSTPNACLSRRNSCSTFSIYMGLASVLNERGIKAVTPSALNTPTGQNFSPTITPCNSPENSSPLTPPSVSLFSLFSLGTEKIRKKTNGEDMNRSRTNQQKIILSRLEKRALRSLKLVEKVESIGLENIITTPANGMVDLADGIASRCSNSSIYFNIPKSKQNSITNDGIQFNRDQIKCVLSKGLAITKTFKNNETMEENEEYSHLMMPTARSESSINDEKKTRHTSGIRLKQIQRQKGRRFIKSGTGNQRQDLGTIDVRVRTDSGSMWSSREDISDALSENSGMVEINKEKNSCIKQSFVGSISSLLFGRKGGWL